MYTYTITEVCISKTEIHTLPLVSFLEELEAQQYLTNYYKKNRKLNHWVSTQKKDLINYLKTILSYKKERTYIDIINHCFYSEYIGICYKNNEDRTTFRQLFELKQEIQKEVCSRIEKWNTLNNRLLQQKKNEKVLVILKCKLE